MRAGDWQFNVRLRVLRLAGNRIISLKEGSLEKNSLLRELDISNNAVDSLNYLPHLKCLDTLNVSNNKLKSLEGIQRAPHVVVLHAEVCRSFPLLLVPTDLGRCLGMDYSELCERLSTSLAFFLNRAISWSRSSRWDSGRMACCASCTYRRTLAWNNHCSYRR